MSGISSAIRMQTMASFLDIPVSDKEYGIGWKRFKRGASDSQLLTWTGQVIKAFQTIRQAINASKSLHLDEDICHTQLVEMAKWGGRAYREFFLENPNDDAPHQLLAARFKMMEDETPAPTFISEQLPFPWEVLYQGRDYREGDPAMFWGLRYSPSRILTPDKDISDHTLEQALPSDMLFCLHHQLLQAHQFEWPHIEQLIKVTRQGRFRLLGPVSGLNQVYNGETLLEYLDQASHNMLHFACHCQQCQAGSDALLISLVSDQESQANPPVIQLENYTFVDIKGHFQRQPLVFLNACQSAGGMDELRATFNLPRVFIDRGAAAVVATACLVPDLFAAAFARKFYEFFLHGQENVNEHSGEKICRLMTIGEALRAARWHFLKEYNNPLGLAHGLYSPAEYKLAQPPLAGGLVNE